MHRPAIKTGSTYHIYNRGVEKRKVFLDPSYHSRFISLVQHYLKYDYPYSALQRRLDRATSPEGRQIVFANLEAVYAIKKPPVEVISFCLMPNHYHLTLKQLDKSSIASFMHKIGTGYTNYFNIRQERTGRLFESTYKTVLIESEEQLVHLTRYHHLNPTSLGAKTRKDLVSYPWSSLSAYLGKERFSFVKSERVLSGFTDRKGYLDFVLAKTDEYEPLRLQRTAVDDDLGWFADFRALKKEHRDRLREKFFAESS